MWIFIQVVPISSGQTILLKNIDKVVNVVLELKFMCLEPVIILPEKFFYFKRKKKTGHGQKKTEDPNSIK